MTAILRSFVGERLAQARRARGLTAVSLAELLGVSSSTISQLEHAKQSPRPELFERMASTLNVPASFFTQPIVLKAEERATKWRSNSTATKFARERAEIRYDWLREIVAYLDAFLDFPSINFPDVDFPLDFREASYAQIDGAAMECRRYWGLGTAPAPNIVLMLESYGCIVSRGKLNAEGLDAFSEWLPGDRPYIFLGSDIGVGVRSRFDAAHELGHLVMHRHVSKKQYGKPEDFKVLEKQAHRFAASFLLPKEQFFKEVWAPTLDTFETLKPRWKASIKGMIVNSHRHGALTDTQYQRAMINYNRRWKNGESHDESIKPEQPRFLARCFDMLVQEGLRTKEEIVSDLSLAAHDIEDLAVLPRGYFSGEGANVVSIAKPVPRESALRNASAKSSVVEVDFSSR